MDVIYGLLPGMLLLGLVAVVVFFWAARSGQFEDMEGEAHRILLDEDLADDDAHSRHKKAAKPRTEGEPPAPKS